MTSDPRQICLFIVPEYTQTIEHKIHRVKDKHGIG